MNLGEGLQDDWEEHGPEERRVQGSLIVVFYHLIGNYAESKDFLKVPAKSTCYRNSNFGHWNNQTHSKLSWPGPWATWSHFWSQPCLEQDPRQYNLVFTFNQNPPMFLWFCVWTTWFLSVVKRTGDMGTEWCMWACTFSVWKLKKNRLDKWTPKWTENCLGHQAEKIVISVSRSRQQPAECSNGW